MAGGKERVLRRRIKSVQSTKKITKAMELIAASRILKAQQRVNAARPYSEQITEVIRNLAAAGAGQGSALLQQREDVPARVAMTMLEYAERSGPVRDGLEFELARTQEDLASELATTRESVARAMGRLRRAGTIEQRGARIRIVDLAALQSTAYSGLKGG